jgi:hypothetical protein
MSKPWDHLRAPAITPIRSGEWRTSTSGAHIHLDSVSPSSAVLTIKSQSLSKHALTELRDFLTELIDQLED